MSAFRVLGNMLWALGVWVSSSCNGLDGIWSLIAPFATTCCTSSEIFTDCALRSASRSTSYTALSTGDCGMRMHTHTQHTTWCLTHTHDTWLILFHWAPTCGWIFKPPSRPGERDPCVCIRPPFMFTMLLKKRTLSLSISQDLLCFCKWFQAQQSSTLSGNFCQQFAKNYLLSLLPDLQTSLNL